MTRLVGSLVLALLASAVLAGLTVGAASQSPALAPPTPSTAPIWLGNPIARQAYTVRHIWDLQAWRDRVYIGYGDWIGNRGPVSIWHYDLAARAFLTETAYISETNPAARVIPENSIDHYVVIDDSLYIPGTDPREPWSWGNFYRNDGTGWVKYRTIPNGVHDFDMAGYQGELFAAGATAKWIPVMRSSDGGLTWTAAISKPASYVEFYALYEQAGTLYAVQSSIQQVQPVVVYQYQEPRFVPTTIKLVPDRPDKWIIIYQDVFSFGDTILCVPWSGDLATGCIQPLQALYQAGPGQDGQAVSFFEGKNPRDVVVTGGLVYVLDAGAPRCIWGKTSPDPAGYTATVYASTDLSAWVPAATGHFTDTPSALEVLDDRAYVGTYNGDLYALDLALPELHLAALADADRVSPNSRLTYTLAVTNDGDAPAAGLVLTDALPLNTTLAVASEPYKFDGSVITWTRPALAAGESWAVTVAVTVGQVASGTVVVNDRYGARCAGVAASTAGGPVRTRVALPSLRVSKSADAEVVSPGSRLVYTLALTNDGEVQAAGLVLTDTLPLSTTLAAASEPHALSDPVVTWTRTVLAAGETWTVTVAVTVGQVASGTVIANDRYGAGCAGPVTASAGGPVRTRVALPSLHLAKSADADRASPGGRLAYTLAVTNDGVAPAMGLVLTDALPLSTTFAAASAPHTLDGSVVAWTRPALAPGETWAVTVAVTVGQVASGTVIANDQYGARCAGLATSTGGGPVYIRVAPPIRTEVESALPWGLVVVGSGVAGSLLILLAFAVWWLRRLSARRPDDAPGSKPPPRI